MPFRTLIVLLAAAVLCAAASAAPRVSAPLDAELAIDTTGSMAPSIRRIQRDTEKLVKSIRKMSPGAHVALV